MTLSNSAITERINTLLDQAYIGRINNLSESIELAKEALKLSRSIDDKSLIGNSLNKLGLFYMIICDFENSNKASNEAIEYFISINNKKGIADAKYTLGSVLYKSDNYHKGLSYMLEALVLYKKLNDIPNLSKVEKAVGTIYEYLGDTANAFRSYKNAVKNARKIKDINLESNVFNNLSGLVLKKGKLVIAMRMITHSIKLKLKSGDRRGYGFALYGRAKVYLRDEEYKKAETDFKEALSIFDEEIENVGSSMVLSKLGQLYYEQEYYKKAEKTVKHSLVLTVIYNISVVKIKNYYLLYNIYKDTNKIIESLDFLERYIKGKEMMMSTQTVRIIENYDLINRMKTIESEAIIQKAKQKAKQKAIDKKNRDQKKILKQKQEFLSIMSHEIRTPLNAITTIVSLLKDKLKGENKKLFNSLQFASDNLIIIVNDILDFTKLDSNKSVIEESHISFEALCSNILNLYVNAAKNKGINLVLVNDVPEAQHYLIDQPKMAQIIGNLISNAIKFTDDGSVVFTTALIEQDTTHDTIRFSIKDTGEGIFKDDLEVIFDSFSQIKPITTREQGGTGLGLAIVKKLVALHGGKITVKSKLNEGSEFYFKIKLKRVAKKAKIEITDFELLKGKNALIAEDTELNATLMKKVLNNWGVSSDHAKDGKAALEAAKNKQYDFILMDVHMPIMNGFEATKLIKTTRNKNKKTPVFAVTADVLTNDDKNNAYLFDAILWKPLEIDKLFNALSVLK